MNVTLYTQETKSEQHSNGHEALEQPCLFTMLETYVKQNPKNIAIQDSEKSILYSEFYEQVSHNADHLNHIIETDEQCVGLFCDPSIDMITGAWSILASERAYLPLASEYPEERIRYMIEDSGVQVILTQDHLKSHLLSIVPSYITVLTLTELNSNFENKKLINTFRQHDERLAYIIYTSGSTGKPKGVMITYKNISNQIQFMKNKFGFDKDDCIIQKTPASFDAAQWEILSVAFGSKIVVGPKDCYRDPDAIIETILNYKVSVLQCVPTLLQALVDHPLFPDAQSLKQVFSGGEILTRNLSKEFFQRLPRADLINLYGPTECTINTSTFILSRESLDNYPDAISIGKPVANTLYHVLKKDGTSALVGEIGELYISGYQISKGYYQRPKMTAEKFLSNPRAFLPGHEIMYKTGDLVKQDIHGNTHFIGRSDSQIKLRGYRVELDEIRLAIENHEWVKTAAMVVKNDPRTGHQNLIACVELNEKLAPVMDQGNHDNHHQSKSSKLQVKAQLSNSGCQSLIEYDASNIIPLSGKEATAEQRSNAFGRKTYRFFDSKVKVSKAMLINLLERQPTPATSIGNLDTLSMTAFGKLLRNFGQFISEDRLLPKYAYASPGALYATQMYFEINGVLGIDSGIYYYHPAEHCLVLCHALKTQNTPELNVHFIGKCDAIKPVYKNNILEVLEMETGHMLGLFDELLPALSLSIVQNTSTIRNTTPSWYDGENENIYLGSYRLEEKKILTQAFSPSYFVQIHGEKVDGLSSGLYRYKYGELQYLTKSMLEKNDVIAINQKVFERSSFGIGLVCNTGDTDNHYIHLGRALHRLQNNSSLLGLMSSGYSSKTNNDLQSAVKMRAILNEHELPMESLYFCVGGPVSIVQYQSEGMNEDRVHMQGPAEILKEDLALQLPQYMIPNKVIILNKFPQTANGKTDLCAINQLEELNYMNTDRELVPLATQTEHKIGGIWCSVMKWKSVSATDHFFESGGNSLTAVALISKINAAFDIKMPLQVLFQTPNIPDIAKWIDTNESELTESSRLLKLNNKLENPVFCWPGLGGYPLNLKLIATELLSQNAFYGIQALGINIGETPLPSVQEMAKEDIKQIKAVQPEGPYRLWGYSFGARVAFETAVQLEMMGDKVESLHLLAPGAPVTQKEREQTYEHEASFENPVFLAILFSVFAHKVDGKLMERCLESCRTESDFLTFICQRFPVLQKDIVQRIIKIVTMTYGFSYQFSELKNRNLNAPITIIKAQGDHYSFLENSPSFSKKAPTIVELNVDHYQVLKESGVKELKEKLNAKLL